MGEEAPNLLRYSPKRTVRFLVNADGRITLLTPKFKSAFLRRKLLPRMKRPYFRINLDEYGSWVWNQIDGRKTVMEIGEAMRNRFGQEAEPVYPRLGLFINHLARQKLISLGTGHTVSAVGGNDD